MERVRRLVLPYPNSRKASARKSESFLGSRDLIVDTLHFAAFL